MDLAFHVRLIGLVFLLLAASHVFFARRFRWKEELARLSLLNRRIFQVHCGFIVLMLIQFGMLSVIFTDALLEPTPLGRLVAAGLVVFWGARLLAQFLVYDRRLWKGDRFRTAMHVVFSFIWLYATCVYGWVLATQWRA